MSALVLFDVDGTLLLSGGAGVRAMTRAFERVFSVPNAFRQIPVAGHTDSFLVSRALAVAGLEDTPDAHARFRAAYLELLPDEIRKPGHGRRGVMPGVPELLAHLAAGDGWHSALLTGNYEPAARVKLEYYGIGGYFTWGAFGDDAADRGALARIAVERAAARGVPEAARANVIVVGDTPHDIACARAIGARALAVATGGSSVEELEASGPDVVLPDLSDLGAVIRVL